MTQPADPPANRHDRRRAATRSALIGAAREILAQSTGTDISIQRIAEQADVGFGTFYNHFSTKAELFEAALTDSLEEYGRTVDALTADIEDPAEVFAASVRLTVLMVESAPQLMQILRRHGLGQLNRNSGLAPRALRDLERAAASGRFELSDPQATLFAIGGALIGLVEYQFSEPPPPSAPTGESVAELLLRMLGLPAEEAREIASRPLPLPLPLPAP
ncbi:transcriptional regulator, TetR family [Catenulispora acidiphila DSM 44928]|uniref:Transcriptional regulator, TetR family n=1 Tax=Catenulispora acidiphila (strain DSM 44928 / JCM 14897 / NBRC 102108 / NRRL B-24433 / ID139908) TaxID=479433 RepID=C7PWN8_CATAD|nr:TetR/AcrR family transcriptional regulator [Catenulispora acidiphila]ACU75318.1 transcriptional regulator, TetR family [Catenulispora acidiphila DSM 44928]